MSLRTSTALAVLLFGMSSATAQTGGNPQTLPPPGGADSGLSTAPGKSGQTPNIEKTTPGSGASAQGEKIREEKSSPSAQGEKMREEKSSPSAQGGKMKEEKSGGSAQSEPKSGATGASDKKAAGAEGGKSLESGRSAASVSLTTQQRSTTRERLVTKDVNRVNIDINLNVGAVVPTNVRTYVRPIPVWLVELVPAYSGFVYIVLADGRIVILEPASYEVVTIVAV